MTDEPKPEKEVIESSGELAEPDGDDSFAAVKDAEAEEDEELADPDADEVDEEEGDEDGS